MNALTTDQIVETLDDLEEGAMDLMRAIERGESKVAAAKSIRKTRRALLEDRETLLAEIEREKATISGYRELIFQVAAALNCLPSVYPDGNTHLVDAANRMRAILAEVVTEVSEYRDLPLSAVLREKLLALKLD
jgi:hypothetical protein